MPEYSLIRAVEYRPDDMFKLVSDIENYPSFVPTISALRIKNECFRNKDRVLLAEAIVRYKFIKESFTTEVCCDEEQYIIDVALVSGPFKILKNRWRFEKNNGKGCLIHFWIHYEFTNRILDEILRKKFSKVVVRLLNAFEEQAGAQFLK